MAEPTLMLASSSDGAQELHALWQRVSNAWPGTAPESESIDVADLADALIAQSEGQQSSSVCAVIVLLDEGTPKSTIIALAHLLRDSLAFGFIMMPGMPEDIREQVSGGGLVGVAADLSPDAIATTLHALMGRQDSVGVLQRELKILSSFQGGVRQEMDRMHEELNLAAAIQQELLPAELPTAEGLDFGVMFRPATYVSGDIYDAVMIDDHRLWFFVADAVGHGVPAALLTMIISRSLRGGAKSRTPAEAMTALNSDLVRTQRGRSRFATAVCGVIDTRTREVTLCTAGHPPALILGGTAPRAIESGCALLGVFDGEPYEQESFVLGDGETLLLYSDGFETAFPDTDAGAEAGKLDTQAYLGEFAKLPWIGSDDRATTANAIHCLAQRVDCQAGSLHQQDDLTALAIAVLPRTAQRTRAA
ncbi:MAG: PP2C family protein-serine/threonine phosphatase [Phycisphaerales bacterium]